MSEKGQISIHTDNIFPIIKKWLYSEKEIFLRELVANASDAITKINKLALVEDIKRDIAEAKITIVLDKKARTLTISDTGLGLTEDEVKKYINQVAFSGVKEFVDKYHDKGDKEQIIGHFGLGFYSSFMVAEKVEIESLSYQDGSSAVHWSCDGQTDYEITPGSRKEVGTSIILTISEDSKEMLEESKISEILAKYCQFIRYPIEFNGKAVNDPKPIWTLNPSQLSDKDYLDFFHKLFPGNPDPLFWIHLNVDYPFKLKGVLFFPKIRHELDAAEGRVKLFCNQVFVSDNAKELIPEFLLLLKGTIDCPELPLNVSRSYLQNDPQARKISQHIVKKVADRLEGMAKTEPELFEKYWDDINPFIKYGMLREESFYDRLIPFVLYKTCEGKYLSLDKYLEINQEKSDKFIFYTNDPENQANYLRLFREQSIDVVIANTMMDSHFLSYVEMKSSAKYKFKRIDSDLSEFLVNKDGGSKIIDPKDQRNEEQKVEELFKRYLSREKIKIKVQSLKSEKVPALLLWDENMRRLDEMAKMSGNKAFDMGGGEKTLVVNQNSPAIKNLVRLSSGISREEEMKMLVNQVFDLAYLQHARFDAKMMEDFLDRSANILERIGQNQ
ncbi:MAG: molecular chaperone HtpG [Oligoflexales bacterium]|nr:molecular chaperone HtpG [Oligoflexales bacterium]